MPTAIDMKYYKRFVYYKSSWTKIALASLFLSLITIMLSDAINNELINVPFAKKMISAECFIANYAIEENTCLNERNYLSYICYDGYVLVVFYTKENNVFMEHVQYGEDKDKNIVLNNLQHKYPIGNLIPCYYNKNDPTDVKLYLTKLDHQFIAILCRCLSMCLFGIGLLILLMVSYARMIIRDISANEPEIIIIKN